MTRSLLFTVLALLATRALAELPPALSASLQSRGLPDSAVGLIVQRVSDGATVLAHGADQSLQPASTMKVLTGWAALERLGPAYRGRTELRSIVPVANGVLNGDLTLRGLGDLDLDWRAFERMLQRVRHAGLREIRGDFHIDRTWLEPARPDMGVPPFDESPEFRYNVIPDALLLNANLVEIDLDSDDRVVRAHLVSPLDRVKLVSKMTLVDRKCADWEDGWKIPEVHREGKTLVVTVHGEYPRRCSASTAVNVLDRVQFADRMFRALWKRLGGTFHGRTYEGRLEHAPELLASHRSRPLNQLVHDLNKISDNPTARVLYLTMGALSSRAGETTNRRAELEVRELLDRHGIPQAGLVLDNGSGLSREERLTPQLLAGVLRAASAGSWAPEFAASLPIAAVDGTMRNRLKESPVASRARLKTGTLRDVSGLAGYMTDAAGTLYTVVILLNDPLARRQVARPILDEYVDWIARNVGTAR